MMIMRSSDVDRSLSENVVVLANQACDDYDDDDGHVNEDVADDDDDSDVDRSLSENVVYLAKTRERRSVLICSICLVNQLAIGEDAYFEYVHFFQKEIQKMKFTTLKVSTNTTGEFSSCPVR